MKIQSLAVIFIIIIIPIAMLMSEYIDNKITLAKLEDDYDSKLLNSTYSAIKAYQLNTVNNAFGDVTNEDMKNIEASVKTFYDALISNFNYSGYNSNVMKEYVPAVVYTLYDGYYIYSPYENILTEVQEDSYDTNYSNSGEIRTGLKPYIYYTCRYTKGTNSDFTITYTLDNYITIQGEINGKYVYDCGYLYNVDNSNGISYNSANESYSYGGIEFTKNDNTECMKEYVGQTEYQYVKINGKKYYLDEDYYQDRGSGDRTVSGPINGSIYSNVTFNKRSGIFYIDSNGNKDYSQTKGYSDNNNEEDNDKFLKYYLAITKNKSAYEYFKKAYEFSKAVLDTPVPSYKDKAGKDVDSRGYGLKNLKWSNATIYDNLNDSMELKNYESDGDKSIFDTTGSDGIEYADSNFNKHRSAVIRYVVETNLQTSIAAFSSNAGGSNFIMPKISETDWEVIENDICAISFLQGLNLGDKKYNGYAVVANNLSTAYVDENDIYILNQDSNGNRMYSKPNDNKISSIITNLGYQPGILKTNFEMKQDKSTGNTIYYEPMSYLNSSGRQTGYLGSYTSIIGSSGLVSIKQNGGIYKYMKDSSDTTLKRAYYTALARERWGSYNDNNVNYEIYQGTGVEYFLNSYP